MAKTVDYGIDLGTTNSSIARMTAKGVEIIPIKSQLYVPSAVARDSRGNIKVGAEAVGGQVQAVKAFKRHMGSTELLKVEGGDPMSPQELSSLVLKELKKAAKLRTDEDVVDVVITVPAMFSQPQCAATQEAARLAGINAVTLLQEPIAAATAYLSDDPIPGYYLVYDLGGGTFDVSLIRLHDGEMQVIEHGGDNYLGGTDFDRLVFDWVLDQIKRKGGDISIFSKGAPKARLLDSVEDARKELSDTENAFVYIEEDDMPTAKLELTRSQLEDLVEDLVDKTIRITIERISKAGLSQSDIRSILLVGGPTQMPYIRRRLKSESGISLNLDQDPMTVVAKGAAIHAAGMLRDQRKPKQKKTDGTLQLEIHYEPISPEPEQVIAGKIVSPEGFLGEVQLSSDSGDWESGWITLKKSAFSATISLGRDASRTFSIRVRDGQGDLKPCEPNKFTVRSGVRSAAPVVPYNYGVVLYGGNQVKWIVESGASIPATGVAPLVLAKTIVAGSPEERVIHFVEGHSLFPSDNLLVGSFAIQGTELKRTLNENTDVEVRIRVDESRLVSARLYVPLIDEYFDVKLKSLTDPPSAAVLEEKLLRAKADLDEIEDEVSEEDQNQILQVERDLELLEAHMSRVTEGEQGEADRIHKHVSDAYARIRPLREKYLPSARFNVLIEFIADADELCAEFNDSMGRARLADIKQDAEKAHRLDQPNIIEELFDRVAEIFWTHYGKTRACWEWQVQNMKNRAVFATDPLTYHELIRKAETALAEEDFKGVALSASRARELIPEVAQGRSEYHDAALR